MVPGDYATSSLPCAVFVWTVENVSTEPLDVSLMFSFQNGDGGPNDRCGGHTNSAFAATPEGQPTTSDGQAEQQTSSAAVVGVALKHLHRSRKVFNPEVTFREGPTPTHCFRVGGSSENNSFARAVCLFFFIIKK